jgi:hypothetical protein
MMNKLKRLFNMGSPKEDEAPGPYYQDPSREAPSKEQRENAYPTEKKPVGDTFKR